MSSIRRVESIIEANALIGKETLHPMVTVIDFSKHGELHYIKMNIGFYGVFLKTAKDVDLFYGRHQYDYNKGTLIFIAPGQVVGFNEEKLGKKFRPTGWALMFHPDLLQGSPLAKRIHDYTFFSYDVHEALHVSEQEKQIVIDCFSKIEHELGRGIDKHSKTLILSNIELFLNYCVRFYDRQFITRDNVNRDVLTNFESILDDYFSKSLPNTEGLPTVAYCAAQLNLSANYFGDLVKKETGKSAQEYIQAKLISIAKERISEGNKSMSEIAYELGFKYPQHFTRLFKQKVGVTPNQFRSDN
ncbi:helix-turn-helix transcriptional regulator [Chryseolinea sp. T2]|uniref:helix-turn-helix domain-containing protein n=1 Tax=Chryseolinea sp. T2 TaxID=3129255 RepID=UPI00307733CF